MGWPIYLPLPPLQLTGFQQWFKVQKWQSEVQILPQFKQKISVQANESKFAIPIDETESSYTLTKFSRPPSDFSRQDSLAFSQETGGSHLNDMAYTQAHNNNITPNQSAYALSPQKPGHTSIALAFEAIHE